MGNPLPLLNQNNITMAGAEESKTSQDSHPEAPLKPNSTNNQGADPSKKRSGSRAQASGGISNVVTKFSFATKGGIAPHNPYKVNQDAYLTNPNLLNLRHCHFFSVCDGHGHYGQEVSGLLKHRLPFNIESGL